MSSRFPEIICSSDLDRLYQAREILLQDLENPPSLLDLAKQVGLNDYKLKAGFRRVFGTTVFGYLHEQRMTQAHDLLTSSDLPVTEIANQVGYTSLSAFSTAFKKFFGIRPSSCRIRDR
jgi:AraC family transcriptional regulator, transcriptional activator of the genes for pyochelin and ferripyochelin receptors